MFIQHQGPRRCKKENEQKELRVNQKRNESAEKTDGADNKRKRSAFVL